MSTKRDATLMRASYECPKAVSELAFIRVEIASPDNQLAGPHFTGNLTYFFTGIDNHTPGKQKYPGEFFAGGG